MYFFNQLAFSQTNTKNDSDVKQELFHADVIGEQLACVIFNENASRDWQDTIQNESGLELCSQQKNKPTKKTTPLIRRSNQVGFCALIKCIVFIDFFT